MNYKYTALYYCNESSGQTEIRHSLHVHAKLMFAYEAEALLIRNSPLPSDVPHYLALLACYYYTRLSQYKVNLRANEMKIDEPHLLLFGITWRRHGLDLGLLLLRLFFGNQRSCCRSTASSIIIQYLQHGSSIAAFHMSTHTRTGAHTQSAGCTHGGNVAVAMPNRVHYYLNNPGAMIYARLVCSLPIAR